MSHEPRAFQVNAIWHESSSFLSTINAAVRAVDLEALERLLRITRARGCSGVPLGRDLNGDTPLGCALATAGFTSDEYCHQARVHIVSMLLEQGADPNVHSGAAIGGDETDDLAPLQILLDNAGNWSPSYFNDVLVMLLNKGANTDPVYSYPSQIPASPLIQVLCGLPGMMRERIYDPAHFLKGEVIKHEKYRAGAARLLIAHGANLSCLTSADMEVLCYGW